jgi:hypothetical protein
MALMTLKTLVLNSVPVVRDVVTGTVGMGLYLAGANPPASLNPMRPLSQRSQRIEQEPDSWHNHVDHLDAGNGAYRAGRSVASVGVSVCRSLAIPASGTILSRWSSATRGAYPTAAWCFGRVLARTHASAGKGLCERFPLPRAQVLSGGNQRRLGASKQDLKRAAKLAWFTPAGGALSASTRG